MRAAAEPVAHRSPQRVYAVHDLGRVGIAAADLAVGRPRIAVATGLAQRRPEPQVARRGDQALGDRPGDAGVTAARVADGREPARQRRGQPPRRGQRHVAQRQRLEREHVQPDAVRVAVRVDQSRQHRPSAGIDHPVRRLRRVADGLRSGRRRRGPRPRPGHRTRRRTRPRCGSTGCCSCRQSASRRHAGGPARSPESSIKESLRLGHPGAGRRRCQMQIPAAFDYLRAESIDHAISLLEQCGPDSRLVAGGHSLLPMMKLRLARPEWLIDINDLRELDYIERDGDTVRIGAMVRHAGLLESELIGAAASDHPRRRAGDRRPARAQSRHDRRIAVPGRPGRGPVHRRRRAAREGDGARLGGHPGGRHGRLLPRALRDRRVARPRC